MADKAEAEARVALVSIPRTVVGGLQCLSVSAYI